MLRSLFFREYRSGLAADFALPLVVVSTFAAAGVTPRLELSVLLADYLVPSVVALGFATGERCFSSKFKESHLLFLSSLPVARKRIWLTIISARFLASLAGFVLAAGAFTLVVRQFSFVAAAVSETYSSAFMLFLVSYFLGGVWSLLFARTLTVYCLGLPITEMALACYSSISGAASIIPPRVSIRSTSMPWRFIGSAHCSCSQLSHARFRHISLPELISPHAESESRI